jgi:hypothetical protein
MNLNCRAIRVELEGETGGCGKVIPIRSVTASYQVPINLIVITWKTNVTSVGLSVISSDTHLEYKYCLPPYHNSRCHTRICHSDKWNVASVVKHGNQSPGCTYRQRQPHGYDERLKVHSGQNSFEINASYQDFASKFDNVWNFIEGEIRRLNSTSNSANDDLRWNPIELWNADTIGMKDYEDY